MTDGPEPTPEAQRLGSLLADAGLTVATAESMTGGALAEALVAVPGSSEWLAGGVIAYQSRVKFDVLGVTEGPVICASAAREMALGAARVLRTDVGVATTGCAGPEPMEDQPVGTLWVGCAIHDEVHARHFQLDGDGDPAQIRAAAVAAAATFAGDVLGAFARS
jgi:PncC family amidohydrolase